MYNSLYGTYSGRTSTVMYILNNGVEWSITATDTAIRMAASSSETIRIFTYLHHREDTMMIYGFISERERQVFLELIRVSGIGPRQAIRMLSGIGVEELVTALDNGNTDRLSMLPGIGKKTAAKIILALRGKLKLESENESHEEFAEIIDALAEMGFDRKHAKKAIAEISGNIKDEKELFREAIVFLSSR